MKYLYNLSTHPTPAHRLASRDQNDVTESSSAAHGTGPKAVCGFRDGSLSVVDTGFGGNGIEAGGRRDPGTVCGPLLWASKAGHVETVFSCAHKPRDANTLATGSYGSNVKVWHTPTMDLKVCGNPSRLNPRATVVCDNGSTPQELE